MKQKILIIVESPKKINTILKYLPSDNDYVVVASQGHIADLAKTGKHKLGIDVENNFDLHYKVDPKKLERLETIINAASICDKILMATDEDREGECIAALIRDRIKTCQKPIKRIAFPEITKTGVIKGLSNERNIDENLVSAAKARRALDRIVGYMGSPFVIKYIGNNMSAGRVQSVALRLVVDRENEIINFKPQEYWTIKANLAKFASEPFVATLHTKDIIPNTETANNIKSELETSSYVVTKVVAKPRKRNPYPALNTARLQMAAAARYKISPAKTMAAAQELYENGLITYMRTDSTRLSDEAIDMARKWIKDNHPSGLPDKPNIYKVKDSAQNAHEAIRPSDVNTLPKSQLITDTDKVYKVIWDFFVACQMTPAIYDTTSVTIMTNNKRELRATGSVLRDPGWLVITSNFDDEDDDDENKLPQLLVDDVLSLVEPKIVAEQKFTQPPPRYKEPTLIKELEKRGIGRPSTYAAIMEKICETRHFVDKKNDVLYPSESGTKVVNLLMKYFKFMEYDFTADMEKKLDLVESGKYKYVDAMRDFYVPFYEELRKANKECLYETDYVCSVCNSVMLLKKSLFGYFLGCEAYPKCKNTIPCTVENDKIVVTPKEIEYAPDDVKCPTCNGKMMTRAGKYGKYYSCVDYPNCKGARKIPYGKKCPNCNNDLYKTIFSKPPHKGIVLCCMGYPNCNYIEELDDPEAEKEIMDARKTVNAQAKNFKVYNVV